MSEMTRATTILFVDPEPSSLDSLREEAKASADAPVIDCVGSVSDAIEALGNGMFDAVALNLSVGDDAASTLVGEIERRFPGVPLIAYTPRRSDEDVAVACHLGAAAILVRPISLATLNRVLAMPVADAGFAGSCTGVPTAQLLTLHCAAGADGILHLRCAATARRDERIGSIYLEGGQPIHATAGALVGSEAVHAMLGWMDAEATWIPGFAHCARTIVGRWEGLIARALPQNQIDDPEQLEQMVAVAYPDVVEKLSRLAQTPDVLGAFLIRHAEVITGRCTPDVDESLASRALCRPAHVYFDVEAQPSEEAGREIQAIVGSMRLVLDRIGPAEAGFQVGVLVRQAAPVCKSLRRLLRQIDVSFSKALKGKRRRPTHRPSNDGSSVEQRVA